MDLASVVAALASVGVRVSGSTPNSSVQVDSSRACATGLAGPEPSGTFHDPGQHFHAAAFEVMPKERGAVLVEYLPTDPARVPRPWMWSFTGEHPEKRYGSWDDRVTVRECARFCAVRCLGRCGGSFLAGCRVPVCVASRWAARVGNG